jgi:hypothetical protein
MQYGFNGNPIRIVQCFTMQYLCSSFDLWPDYVKIDIDGQEKSVIKSMGLPLPASLLVEINEPWTKKSALNLIGRNYTTDNKYNTMTPHSSERRQKEGITAKNIIFTRIT